MKWILASALSAGLLTPVTLLAQPAQTTPQPIVLAAKFGDGHDRGREPQQVIAINQVTVILGNKGYRNVAALRDRGDCYTARAMHPGGYLVDLEVNRYNGSILKLVRIGNSYDDYDRRHDDRYDDRDRRNPRADDRRRNDRRDDDYHRGGERQRIAQAAQVLWRNGYLNVNFRYSTGRHYVFYATEKRGRVLKVFMNKNRLWPDYYEVVGGRRY